MTRKEKNLDLILVCLTTQIASPKSYPSGKATSSRKLSWIMRWEKIITPLFDQLQDCII